MLWMPIPNVWSQVKRQHNTWVYWQTWCLGKDFAINGWQLRCNLKDSHWYHDDKYFWWFPSDEKGIFTLPPRPGRALDLQPTTRAHDHRSSTFITPSRSHNTSTLDLRNSPGPTEYLIENTLANIQNVIIINFQLILMKFNTVFLI